MMARHNYYLLLLLLIFFSSFVFENFAELSSSSSSSSSIDDSAVKVDEREENRGTSRKNVTQLNNVGKNRTVRAISYQRSKSVYHRPQPSRSSQSQAHLKAQSRWPSSGGWRSPYNSMRKAAPAPSPAYLPYGAGPGRPPGPGGGGYLQTMGQAQYYAPPQQSYQPQPARVQIMGHQQPGPQYYQQQPGAMYPQMQAQQPSYTMMQQAPPPQQIMIQPPPQSGPVFSGPVVMQPDSDIDETGDEMMVQSGGQYPGQYYPQQQWRQAQTSYQVGAPGGGYPASNNVIYQPAQTQQQIYGNNVPQSYQQQPGQQVQTQYVMPQQNQQNNNQFLSQQQAAQPQFQQLMTVDNNQNNQQQFVQQQQQQPQVQTNNHLLDVNGQTQQQFQQTLAGSNTNQQIIPPPAQAQSPPVIAPPAPPVVPDHQTSLSQNLVQQQPPAAPAQQQQIQTSAPQQQQSASVFQQQAQVQPAPAPAVTAPPPQQLTQQQLVEQVQQLVSQLKSSSQQVQQQVQQQVAQNKPPVQPVFNFQQVQGPRMMENNQQQNSRLLINQQQPAPQKSVQEAVQEALLQHQQNLLAPNLAPEQDKKADWQTQIQQALRQQQQMKANAASVQEELQRQQAELRAIAVQAVSEYGRRLDDSTEPELVEGLLLPENRRLVKCEEKKFVSTQTKLPNIRCCGARAFNTAKLACLKGHIVDEQIWKEGLLQFTTTTSSTTTSTVDNFRHLAMAFGQSVSDERHQQHQAFARKTSPGAVINEARLIDFNGNRGDDLRRRLLQAVGTEDDDRQIINVNNLAPPSSPSPPPGAGLNSTNLSHKQEQENNNVLIQVDLTQQSGGGEGIIQPNNRPQSAFFLEPKMTSSSASEVRPKLVSSLSLPQPEPLSSRFHQQESSSSALMDILRNDHREVLSKSELFELFRQFQRSYQKQQAGTSSTTQSDFVLQPFIGTTMVPSGGLISESLNLPNGTFTLRCGGQSWLTREPPSFFACCGDILNRLGRVRCDHGDQARTPFLINYDESERARKLPKGVALAVTDPPPPPLLPPPIPQPIMPELVPGEPEIADDSLNLQRQAAWSMDDDLPVQIYPSDILFSNNNTGSFITNENSDERFPKNKNRSSPVILSRSRDNKLPLKILSISPKSTPKPPPVSNTSACQINDDPGKFCCGKFVYKKQPGQVCCDGNYGISETVTMGCCGPIPFNTKTHACSESSYVVLRR